MKSTTMSAELCSKQEFVTAGELKKYCQRGGLIYDHAVRYLEERGHLIRVFRGIFYIKKRDQSVRYNHLELAAKGLELKGIKKWYFGLRTSLQLNNMTHEYFVIDEVLNDTLSRPNFMMMNGRKFHFSKVSEKLLDFGIKQNGLIRYSDPEKTILDFIYLGKYNRMNSWRIISIIGDWMENISRRKIDQYAAHYPKPVIQVFDEAYEERSDD